MQFPEPSKLQTLAFFVGIPAVLMGAGYGAGKGIEWVWPFIKAYLHAVTA